MGYETWKSLEDPSLINGFLASVMMNPCMQNVPEGNVSILRGHSIAHSKQKCICTVHVSYSERLPKSYFIEQEFGLGTQYCPSLPPYYAPLGFLLRGWMKSKVYRTKVGTRDELFDLIMKIIASIKESPDALGRATRPVLTRVAKCTDANGGIFENLLYYVKCTNFVT